MERYLRSVKFLALCSLLSCASPRYLAQPPSRESIHGALQQLRAERLQEPPVLVVEADITIPSIAFPVMCRVEIAGSDSLSAEFWGPLGFALGQLWATPEELSYYDVSRNLLVESRLRSETLQQLLGFPLTYESLLALLRQRPPLPEVPESTAWDSVHSTLTLWDTVGNRWEFQLPRWELRAYEIRPTPERGIRILYSEWRTSPPAYAKVVQLVMPSATIVCRIREYRFRESPSGPYRLAVPSNAARIVLE